MAIPPFGTPPVNIGSLLTKGTSGSVPYIDSNKKLAQDNANLFYDATNKRLGVGTAAPTADLSVKTGGVLNVGNINLGGVALNVFSATATGGSIVAFQANGLTNGGRIISTVSTAITGNAYVINGQINCSGQGVFNIQQNGNGTAILQAVVLGTGDAMGQYSVNGGQVWSFGLDQSDTSKFKLSNGGTLGTGDVLIVTTGNKIGVQVNAPTALLHIAAGTSSANTAPLKLTSGTNLATAEAGAIEYNGRFFLTDTDATQRHIVQAVASTKTTAGAPYTNDGYVQVVINGTTIKLMTTA